MKSRIAACGAAMALCLTAMPSSAAFVFGFTGGSNTAQELILGLAGGGTIVLDTGQDRLGPGLNQGWWSSVVANFDGNDNFVASTELGHGLNDFFTFSLAGLGGLLVETATLRVNSVGTTLGPFPFAFSLFDVDTDAGLLNATVGTSPSIHDDLGSGKSYGVYSIGGDLVAPFSMVLNAAAVADINAAAGGAGYFSIGGTLAPTRQVSEPTTPFLIGVGFVGLGLRRRTSRPHPAGLSVTYTVPVKLEIACPSARVTSTR